MNESGFGGETPWTTGCDMKSKPTLRAFETAFNYVERHIEQDCLVKIWPISTDDLPAR